MGECHRSGGKGGTYAVLVFRDGRLTTPSGLTANLSGNRRMTCKILDWTYAEGSGSAAGAKRPTVELAAPRERRTVQCAAGAILKISAARGDIWLFWAFDYC